MVGMFGGCVCAQNTVDVTKQIEYIDLVHLSHTDYGYTDHPEKPKFCWTAEALNTVYEWWQEASVDRRENLLRAIDSGQFEITAAPFNVNPLHNANQMKQMLNWILSI